MTAKHWSPAKKAAKKHLEYWPEPIRLRLRNRPEKMVPRRLERQERPLGGIAPRGWQRRQVQRKPEQRKPDRTANGIARFRPRSFIGSARIYECRA